MKVGEKIKKGLMGIGAFLSLLPSKVFAISVSTEPLYGVKKIEQSNLFNNILGICRMFVIPIALLIGIIIYLKKSKSNIKRKIITTLAIVVILYFIINNVI